MNQQKRKLRDFQASLQRCVCAFGCDQCAEKDFLLLKCFPYILLGKGGGGGGGGGWYVFFNVLIIIRKIQKKNESVMTVCQS